MSEFRNVTLRERIYDEVVRLIVVGELPRGSQIDERRLSERLSVSRTPFREALGTLAKDGLIETRPYRGTFVRDFTPQQVDQLYEVRRVLEGLAVRLAVPLLTDAEVDAVEAILDGAVSALARQDLDAYAAFDRRFHDTFIQASRNQTLIDTLARLGLQIQVCRQFANREPGVAARTGQERTAILKALRSRDAERTALLMEQHIAGVQRSIKEQLAEGPAAQPGAGKGRGGSA